MEIYVLKHVRHDNVVNYVDFYQDETFLYLVMELHGTQWSSSSSSAPNDTMHCDNSDNDSVPPHSPALSQASEESCMSSPSTPTDEYPPQLYRRRTSCDLFECIERHHNFDEALAKKIFRQIVECIAYLDTLGICHRDIKDENIVIDDQYRVKLIDFGSAVILPRHYGQQKTCYFSKFYGTVSFASPEILLCKPYRAEPAEIWALGVLLYTILFGEVPFTDPSMAIAGRFATPKIPVSYECMHLLSNLLQQSPEKRPNIHQVLSHPFLRD
ncbi:kinase-like domain-containing protein [Zychaea mexicana]|uniref:kinase-like domain-containing protein n=1 Tax=Zychaea mexicana TaxID=64656 RepID=UPI0022FDD8FC|nr:kinase-like domain-containing protein [Zychaea mexicana]KAI9498670.1 kinase-like domain-containing protein [Zychaea mexicana]